MLLRLFTKADVVFKRTEHLQSAHAGRVNTEALQLQHPLGLPQGLRDRFLCEGHVGRCGMG